ncbi:hypothetical protein C8R46DRAFT_1071113 [Mycena filopes]|nr:hypothetical protein C8R46DRAFT_1071113 [Mycena filopes]
MENSINTRPSEVPYINLHPHLPPYTMSPRPNLTQIIAYLGLPKSTSQKDQTRGSRKDKTKAKDLEAKSASQLTVTDMTSLGWRLFANEEDRDWNSGALHSYWDLEVTKDIQKFTKSDPLSIIKQIQDMRKLYMRKSADGRKPIKISSEYKLKEGLLDLNKFNGLLDTQLLKLCLYYVDKETDSKALDWAGKDRKISKDYPALDFMFPTTTATEKAHTQVSESALVALLRLDGLATAKVLAASEISELMVERAVGSALSGIFSGVTSVRFMSGQKLSDIPLVLWATNSVPFPDLASLLGGGAGEIEPVVLVGEAKTGEKGIRTIQRREGKDSKRASPRAQMAAAVHPTLILLVIAHCRKVYPDKLEGNFEKFSAEGRNLTFKEDSVVYGIYYDQAEVRIYAHFPQVEEVEGKCVIRFYQVPVEAFDLLDPSLASRWRLAVSLFFIQKHADMLAKPLTAALRAYNMNSD